MWDESRRAASFGVGAKLAVALLAGVGIVISFTSAGHDRQYPRRSRPFIDRRITNLEAENPANTAKGVYSEILVHPGLLSAEEPARVLLVAEPGSTALCEIVKHRKVKSVQIVSTTVGLKQPEAADYECGSVAAVQPSVVPLTAVVTSRGECSPTLVNFGGVFDVVVVDPLPNQELSEVVTLVSKAAFCLIGPHGTLIAPLGAPPTRPELHPSGLRALALLESMTVTLKKWVAPGDDGTPKGRGGINVYDAYVPALREQLTVAVLCFTQTCSNRFAYHEGAATFAIARRLYPGEIAGLEWYDGGTHDTLRMGRAWERLQCAGTPNLIDCSFYNTYVDATLAVGDTYDYPEEGFVEIRDSGNAKGAGENVSDRGLYTKVPFQEGDSLGYDAATGTSFPTQDFFALERVAERTNNSHLWDLITWIDRYGFECNLPGGTSATYVSLGSEFTFANHGCTPHDRNFGGQDSMLTYPVSGARRPRSYCFNDAANRAVAAGEQARVDYTNFDVNVKTWEKNEREWCGPTISENARAP